MLDLRPSCEHCAKDLPPNSVEARICSFECTFCRDCAEGIFENVCPNCGGGFERRPVRPAKCHKGSAWLGEYPASTERRHRPKDLAAHAVFAADLKGIDPGNR